MPNFAALRAAVFPLSTKNLRGGADIRPPSVRGLNGFLPVNHYLTNKALLWRNSNQQYAHSVAQQDDNTHHTLALIQRAN